MPVCIYLCYNFLKTPEFIVSNIKVIGREMNWKSGRKNRRGLCLNYCPRSWKEGLTESA
jgi:hypothetical protein